MSLYSALAYTERFLAGKLCFSIISTSESVLLLFLAMFGL